VGYIEQFRLDTSNRQYYPGFSGGTPALSN
jgi:hypothetical protein